MGFHSRSPQSGKNSGLCWPRGSSSIHWHTKEGRTIPFATWLSRPVLMSRGALPLYPPNLLFFSRHLPVAHCFPLKHLSLSIWFTLYVKEREGEEEGEREGRRERQRQRERGKEKQKSKRDSPSEKMRRKKKVRTNRSIQI